MEDFLNGKYLIRDERIQMRLGYELSQDSKSKLALVVVLRLTTLKTPISITVLFLDNHPGKPVHAGPTI